MNPHRPNSPEHKEGPRRAVRPKTLNFPKIQVQEEQPSRSHFSASAREATRMDVEHPNHNRAALTWCIGKKPQYPLIRDQIPIPEVLICPVCRKTFRLYTNESQKKTMQKALWDYGVVVFSMQSTEKYSLEYDDQLHEVWELYTRPSALFKRSRNERVDPLVSTKVIAKRYPGSKVFNTEIDANLPKVHWHGDCYSGTCIDKRNACSFSRETCYEEPCW